LSICVRVCRVAVVVVQSKTSGQILLTKGRIADLLPLPAANRFVES